MGFITSTYPGIHDIGLLTVRRAARCEAGSTFSRDRNSLFDSFDFPEIFSQLSWVFT